MVVVAQLVRALDCGSRGRRFETGLPPEKKSSLFGEDFFVSRFRFSSFRFGFLHFKVLLYKVVLQKTVVFQNVLFQTVLIADSFMFYLKQFGYPYLLFPTLCKKLTVLFLPLDHIQFYLEYL